MREKNTCYKLATEQGCRKSIHTSETEFIQACIDAYIEICGVNVKEII